MHQAGYLKNWVQERGIYRDKETRECCVAVLTILDRVEFFAIRKKRVVHAILNWETFRKRYVLCTLDAASAFKLLSDCIHRHGADPRAHELLAIINPAREIPEGEVHMATAKKKPAAEKKAAPKKAAAPKKEVVKSSAPGRKGAFTSGMKITVLAKENPKRGGAAARFDLYAKNNTVEKYLAAGGLVADIRWDSKQGFIQVA